MRTELYLRMSASPYFGYGVCGAHLLREFSKLAVTYIDPIGELMQWGNDFDNLIARHKRKMTSDVDFPLIQFPDNDLAPQTPFKGRPTAAYLFFETDLLTEVQKENLKKYDIVIAGSEWNRNIVRGLRLNCESVPQGVDSEVFRPLDAPKRQNFVIFSGGKFEPRKGQDLVIEAAQVMHQRHPDVMLMTAWFNPWNQRTINVEMPALHLGPVGHAELCEAMNDTDVGVFPNRCEGGTNLVLMEYMACGKPVIASYATGQKDVLDEAYALPATHNHPNGIVADLVDKLEMLYLDRAKRSEMGQKAREAMLNWTWARTAKGILGAINDYR